MGTQLKTRIAKFVVDFAPVIYDTRKKEILKQLVPQGKVHIFEQIDNAHVGP